MAAQLSSDQVVHLIEQVLSKQKERIGELWDWGYGFGEREMNRWHTGSLHCYWLTTPEEYPSIRERFVDFFRQVEALDVVVRVEAQEYQVDDSFTGSELIGEKWIIYFN